MTKADKWLLIGLSLSVMTMVTGYLLWVGFATADNISHLSPTELSDMQQELAVNVELGEILLNAGFVGFSSTLLALITRKVLRMLKTSR